MLRPSGDTARFDVEDTESWLQYLDSHGYVVIKNVASKEECDTAMTLFWDFLESVPGFEIKRNDPTTWEDKHWFPSSEHGIANAYGFGQSKFTWQGRLLPKVETTFKHIWGLDKRLIVSYDGGNAFRPYQKKPQWKTKGGWWHVDQNSLNPSGKGKGKVCIQGLVSYLDGNETTGGLCVISGSHKHHDELCERLPQARQVDTVLHGN
jgi:hypothetical protein